MPELSLEHFIVHLQGSREVGLVVARDVLSKAGLTDHLKAHQYHLVTNALSLPSAMEHHPRLAIDIAPMSDEEFKMTYDFVCQYPTATIQLTDPETLARTDITVNYQEHRTVLLLHEDELASLRQQYPIMERVGMVWRQKWME